MSFISTLALFEYGNMATLEVFINKSGEGKRAVIKISIKVVISFNAYFKIDIGLGFDKGCPQVAGTYIKIIDLDVCFTENTAFIYKAVRKNRISSLARTIDFLICHIIRCLIAGCNSNVYKNCAQISTFKINNHEYLFQIPLSCGAKALTPAFLKYCFKVLVVVSRYRLGNLWK